MGQYFAGLGQGAPKGCSLRGAASPTARIPRINGWKWEWHLIITLRNPLAEFLLPFPMVVWSAGLEVSNGTVCSGLRWLYWYLSGWAPGFCTRSQCYYSPALGFLEGYRITAHTCAVHSLILASRGPASAQDSFPSPTPATG